MGASNDLLTGLALLLEDRSVAVWDESAAYAPDQLGIVIDAVPAGLPDVVTLSDYVVDDDPALSDSTTGLQVRTRRAGADPRPCKDTDDAIFDVLQGYAGLLPNGVRVVSCYRRSGGSMGQDDNDRWMRSSNYYIRTHRPSTNRT